MINVDRKIALTAALGMTLGLAISTVQADVKVQTITHFGGVAGVGASDISDTSYLQGHTKRTDTSIKFTGAVLGTLQKWMSHAPQGGGDITIYRVDQNTQIELHPDKRTYSERPIYTPPAPGEERSAPSGGASNAPRRQQSDVRVVKSELKVRDTGKTRVINGFNTRNYEVTWDVETENLKTHERSRSLMTTELWNSDDPRFQQLRREERAYSQAYLRLLHLPEMYASVDSRQLGLDRMPFASEQGQKELFGKLQQIKGYPVVTDVTWAGGCISGCGADNQPQSQTQQSSAPSSGLGGMLSGLLAKTAEKQAQNQSQQKQNTDGLSVIFTSHTELKSLDTGNLSGSVFEVPAGYTKN
ncbi:MAG: hypothetical protein ACYDCJ_06355 [Gammaproteobacteria bacterium]